VTSALTSECLRHNLFGQSRRQLHLAKRATSTKRPTAPKPTAREEEQAQEVDAEPSNSDAPQAEATDELEPDAIIEATGEVIEDDTGFALDEPIIVPSNERALARVDALQLYMQEVQRHPLLTAEEEHHLADEYIKTGDVKLAARLVTANLRLVVKLAFEYRRAYRNIMDLIQEGNIGLMQAVKRYDPYRGVKLSSYAAWWIRAYILRFILNNWRLVKLGTTQAQRKLFFNLNKEKARLSAMGIEPTHAEVALRLNVDEKDVIEMDRRLASGDASLDVSIGDSEGRQTTRMDLLPASSAGPEQLTEGAELQSMVREQLDRFRTTLAGKELVIFDKRLVAEDPITLQELGDEFGVSRERVRQLEARLTGKLRVYLTEQLGDAVQVTG
jgi:RNA polymerase sigma-32 factor